MVNGREGVAPDTRRRVTEALNRLGYVRRSRAMAAGTPTSQVDMMLTCLDGPRSGAVLRGAEIAADEVGYDLVVPAALARSSGGGSMTGGCTGSPRADPPVCCSTSPDWRHPSTKAWNGRTSPS
ncbi:hypothetical protein [Streptomyces sp. ME19-01-6]|uniref:hypothetical protein n=1 Tax=Streptomyces sp. ME19-01-6 TaxID=3028686 RepID=UPI0029ACFF09|nr:hypothetical protein [Streptomyces sp. ME19-01-6]MDX3233057.1 hypothetical protein [Streptomyces sp. ME19-01-6]